ncbi:MAG TPA: chitinase, partial [Nocardioides bacterium]|nr:chitinase [Nocardioides sp.]
PATPPASTPATPPAKTPPASTPPATLPGGATSIFGGGKFLVAYYGTAQTGALGVLG